MATKDNREEKILRVGIVQAGRLIEERLLRRREEITVGRSPANKFMVPSPQVPVSYRLIDVRGGRYVLCFQKGMLGKVVVGEEVLDLKGLAQRKMAARDGNRFTYSLADDSRGKIVLGDVTLLFQFVTPPPPVPRLQLPPEARGSLWRDLDRGMAAALVFSFLALGGPMGGLEWWWRETGRYLVVQRLSEPGFMQTLVKQQDKSEDKQKKAADDRQIEDNKADRDGDEKGAVEESRIGESSEQDNVPDGSDNEPSLENPGEEVNTADLGAKVDAAFEEKEGPRPELTDAQRAERAKMFVSSKTVVAVIGTDWGEGDGTFGGGARDGMRKMRDGSAFGEGSLEVGGGGGMGSDYWDEEGGGGMADDMGAGGMPGGMGDGRPALVVKGEDLNGGVGGPGSVEVIKGPAKKLDVEKPKVEEKRWKLNLGEGRGFTGGKINRAELNKYLRYRQSAFEKCYMMVARRSPGLAGRVEIKITIGANGRATAKVVSDQTGDPALGQCIVERIGEWSFPKPEDGKPVDLKVPFVFRAL